MWARSGGPASVLIVSVLYAVSGATKQAWALAPQALKLPVCELAYLVVRASIFCIIWCLRWTALLAVTRTSDYTISQPNCQTIWPPFRRQFRPAFPGAPAHLSTRFSGREQDCIKTPNACQIARRFISHKGAKTQRFSLKRRGRRGRRGTQSICWGSVLKLTIAPPTIESLRSLRFNSHVSSIQPSYMVSP